MKRITGLFLMALFPVILHSQEIQQKNVPAVVLNAFQLKFSKASDVEWKLEKGFYRVNFELNDKDNQVLLNDKGAIIRHSKDLYISEIPKSVMETIKSRVTFFDISDADMTEEEGKTSYNISLDIDGKDHEFIVNERGGLLMYEREMSYGEVPVGIRDLIKSRFGSPDIDDALYREEKGRGYYHIRGEIRDMDHVFIFNEKSAMVRHEQDLRNSEVPLEIMNAANASYNGYEIRDADLLDEEGKLTYYLELRKSRETMIVSFSAGGKILEVRNK
ncbi:MAG: PepSY-like domain-containing protein [Bacteroidales bacterium]|nr:PepSY-like domain-containing protein [Bacteroidales bacterium]MBN2631964.1 PepSY-like domain-containing protein [Bacteroidales bacterium]